jgi:hypothetical protein
VPVYFPFPQFLVKAPSSKTFAYFMNHFFNTLSMLHKKTNRKQTMKKLITTFSLCFALLGSIQSVFAADAVIASGTLTASFSSWGKPSIEGDWTIVKSEGKQFIDLADNFKAKKGPDVKIYLSPKSTSAITGKNAAVDSLFIKLISDFEGSARIEIPASIEISQYKTLVFYCEEYSKLWGSSAF